MRRYNIKKFQADTRRVLVLIAPTRSFDRGLLTGIAKYASRHESWTFLREPPHYRQIEWKKKVSDRLRSGSIDAVVMREPQKIEENGLLTVSVLGLIVNIVGLSCFHDLHHHDHDHGEG